MTELADEGAVGGGGGAGRGTSLGKVVPVDSSEVAEASTGAASLQIQSIGIPGDPRLCRAQNSQDGNMTPQISQRASSGLCMTQMVN